MTAHINDTPLPKRAAECRARAKEAFFASGEAKTPEQKEALRFEGEKWLLLAATIDVMTGG
jgi:hypothetical protein